MRQGPDRIAQCVSGRRIDNATCPPPPRKLSHFMLTIENKRLSTNRSKLLLQGLTLAASRYAVDTRVLYSVCMSHRRYGRRCSLQICAVPSLCTHTPDVSRCPLIQMVCCSRKGCIVYILVLVSLRPAEFSTPSQGCCCR